MSIWLGLSDREFWLVFLPLWTLGWTMLAVLIRGDYTVPHIPVITPTWERLRAGIHWLLYELPGKARR